MMNIRLPRRQDPPSSMAGDVYVPGRIKSRLCRKGIIITQTRTLCCWVEVVIQDHREAIILDWATAKKIKRLLMRSVNI